MKTKFNRFAVVPIMCNCCKKYVWLEKYRKAEVWMRFADRYMSQNICSDCIDKFLPKQEK